MPPCYAPYFTHHLLHTGQHDLDLYGAFFPKMVGGIFDILLYLLPTDCKSQPIEPRNPDWYFNQKGDPTKDKKRPDFVKEQRWIKCEYDEFEVSINAVLI
jgi:Cellulose synthase